MERRERWGYILVFAIFVGTLCCLILLFAGFLVYGQGSGLDNWLHWVDHQHRRNPHWPLP